MKNITLCFLLNSKLMFFLKKRIENKAINAKNLFTLILPSDNARVNWLKSLEQKPKIK